MVATPITLGSTTAGGIPYTRMHGSPTFSVTQDASTAKETLIINKANLLAFVFESFPTSEELNDFIDIRRRMDGVKGVTGLAGLFLSKGIEIVPHLTDMVLDDQSYIQVTITYETAQDKSGDEEDDEDTPSFLTHTLNVGGQLLSYPSQHMEVADLAKGEAGPALPPGFLKKIQEPNIPMTVFVPTIEHTWSWAKVPRPPFTAIRDKIGKTNSTAYLGAKVEQLLFLGVSASQDFTIEGEEPWKIDYKFSERNKFGAGWNHFFHPGSGTWQKLKNANDEFAYETTTFNALFKQEPGVE